MDSTQKVTQNRHLKLHTEDTVSGPVQKQIRKIPSDAFLVLSAGSILVSLFLKYRGRNQDSQFVGQWAPTFAILGVFDKLIRSNLNEKKAS